jgi:hypothetical protein
MTKEQMIEMLNDSDANFFKFPDGTSIIKPIGISQDNKPDEDPNHFEDGQPAQKKPRLDTQ